MFTPMLSGEVGRCVCALEPVCPGSDVSLLFTSVTEQVGLCLCTLVFSSIN